MDHSSRPQPTLQLPIYPGNTSALPSGVQPPRSETRQTQKRKQTLLTLLDALTELNNQGLDQDSSSTTLFDEEPELPSVDDQVQAKGAEVFNRFQRKGLDKELQNFANAVRQLGSSVGLLSSSFHLRQRLAQILFLFRENAADLFPRKVKRDEQREMHSMHVVRDRIQANKSRRKRQKLPPNVSRPSVPDDLKRENFTDQLEFLALDITTFLECLNEFPEFTDEAVNASILAFEGDLKYWASCLRDFEGQLRFPAVERYIHGEYRDEDGVFWLSTTDLSVGVGNHIESITSTIGVFVEVGVPTIRFAQKHTASNLLNLSTVATFFSAVTATTIQFSFDLVETPMQNAVNAFWFSSLVFSIASAVNSLLGLTWKQAIYRSPRHHVPWWVLIWIKRSPLIFLVISVAAFSVGLVLFTWASAQHITTQIVTTVFTGFSSFGLVAVSAWFAFERITYSRHKGKRWLADVLSDINTDIHKYSGFEWAENNILPKVDHAAKWGSVQIKLVRRKFLEFAKAGSQYVSKAVIHATRHHVNSSEGILPLPNQMLSTGVVASPPTSPSPAMPRHRLSNASTMPESPRPISSILAIASTEALTAAPEASNTTMEGRASPGSKGRFANVVRSVIMMQNSSPSGTPRKGTGFSGIARALEHPSKKNTRRDSNEPYTAAKVSRIIHLANSLKSLDITETLPAHHALVRHLQFSPNGKWMATCSWDRTSVLYKVGSNGDFFTLHRTLAHPQGFAHQVAWSPKGSHLLTKLHHSVKVWTEVRHKYNNKTSSLIVGRMEYVYRPLIDVDLFKQLPGKLPGGKEFLMVEDQDVHEVNLAGKILASHKLTRLNSHDVAITPDRQRILAVGTLTESPDGLQPHKARREKRIIVYNMTEKQVESQVPLMHDVRDITIASNGQLALVSYEDKAPPQLWRLDKVGDEVRLHLLHTYMPSADVEFAGTSYFGGKDDQLILCAGKNGHIHIWDRESATLLHDIRVPDGDLTGIAWNASSDVPMFATGSHDGRVKIWTSPIPQPPSINHSRSQSRTPSNIPSRSSSCSPDFIESPGPMQPDFEPFSQHDLSRNSSRRERRAEGL
ncbi:WD40 repeat-like protein [Hysterangium stoloniferum]|nr:WD40 repeat-like protein [Hysterangium stoloniferum]